MPDNNKNNININFRDLAVFCLNKWPVFLIIISSFIIGSLIYSYLIITPLYDSTGKIYIMNKSSDNISTSDLSVSSYLTRDYENLIADRAVLEEVAKRLDYKYSYGELKSAVTLYNPENTRFIEISVRTPSANDSKIIVDTVCEVSQEKIVELLGIDRVTIIRNGSISGRPSVPNVSGNVFKSIVIALINYAILMLILYTFNDKINDAEDVEKYLGISVLGNIPCNKNKARTK